MIIFESLWLFQSETKRIQTESDLAQYQKALYDCLSGGVVIFPDTMETLKCYEATHIGRI